MIMTCFMKQFSVANKKNIYVQDKAYFNTETYINLESTDIKEIISLMIREILN